MTSTHTPAIHWRAVETLDGRWQPQWGTVAPDGVKTVWRNVGVAVRDQFEAEDNAREYANRIAERRDGGAQTMTAKVIPIAEPKALNLLRSLAKAWHTREGNLSADDLLDAYVNKALRDGILTHTEFDGWEEEAASNARHAIRQERKTFVPRGPWETE